MSKQKAKAPQPTVAGVYKPDSIRDVAESLGITNLSDSIASALASDVEHRIRQVVEEASRFTRHAHRTTMTTSDIDQALRVLNIEPLYGHNPHNPPTFRRALPFPQATTAGTVYYVEDEEIDFDRVLREEKIPLPKPANWTAHWLAVEGVQPLIPENPPAIPRDTEGEAGKLGASPPRMNGQAPPTPPSPNRPAGAFASKSKQPQLVKQVLSRELQLYYTRLTSALVQTDQVKRTAALSSLASDAGLQTLLPYLVKWVGDGVVQILQDSVHTEQEARLLDVYLEVVRAILDNKTLLVEPYLHQLLPPLLSILLHSSLQQSHSTHLRKAAASILAHLLTQHATTYPSLAPRIMKTLLVALVSTNKSKGTREGAVRGLTGVGREAVRKGLIEAGGARIIGEECTQGEKSPVVDAVLDALSLLANRSAAPTPLNPSQQEDLDVYNSLKARVGIFFAQRVSLDRLWAHSIAKEVAPNKA